MLEGDRAWSTLPRGEIYARGHEQGGEVTGATSPRHTLHAGEPDALAPGMHERGECVRLGRRGLDTGCPSTERPEVDPERLPGTHDARGDEGRASESTSTVGRRLGRRCGLRGEDDHVGRRAESDVWSARRVDGGVHDPARPGRGREGDARPAGTRRVRRGANRCPSPHRSTRPRGRGAGRSRCRSLPGVGCPCRTAAPIVCGTAARGVGSRHAPRWSSVAEYDVRSMSTSTSPVVRSDGSP